MPDTTVVACGFTDAIEGPVVDRTGRLYAMNYGSEGTIGRLDPDGSVACWHELPEGSAGCGAVCGPDGRLYVADWRTHTIFAIDPATGARRVHAHEPAMHQPNDLAVLSDGTLFASDPDWANGTGQLWRIDPDGTSTLVESHMGTTNGIDVSPDERRLYVNETVQRRIWVYDLDAGHRPSGKRLLVRFDDHLLDGMRTDADGVLYVTRTGAGVVARVRPDGRLGTPVRLHGRDCTNVVFGGPDGHTLYVTVADTGCVEAVRLATAGRSHGIAGAAA
ncbi:SMP-30/gluconolactonase/LRE family protein [Micromonospora sp. SL4-19]|uniref:SMP-30/gluconolactonase/LRE family protein n=1 Tax=Micromonospora sp. SL4-19 TaxID=3399129 RepID=UPI003A4D4023